MTVLRGKQILDKVRTKIGDASYGSYDEINDAHHWIAAQTDFTWLRKQSTTAVGLVADTNEYTINLGNVRSVTDFWIKGTSSDYYTLMEELPARMFEEEVAQNSLSSRSITNQDNRWYYHLLAGGVSSGGGAFGKIRVTPTPDTTFTIRVDYIKNLTEIGPDTIPDMPVGYIPTLVLYAAGLILENHEDQIKARQGMRYIQRAESYFIKLAHDSQRNRTVDIDRKPQPWLK